MYLIKNIKNCNFYKNKICKNLNHYVYREKEAKKFRTKEGAKKFLSDFNHPENFEIVKI